MTHANITNQTEMKKQVLKYVDINTEQMWKTFPEYVLAAHSYTKFEDTILDQCQNATGDFIYSIRDMDQLTSERQCVGITTMQDLSNYHL